MSTTKSNKYITKKVLNTEWGTVTLYSNWCYIDRLHDADLEHGDLLEVEWPDGSYEQITVVLDKRTEMYSDHGHTGTMPVHVAYAAFTHHGVECRAPLRGLRARFLEAT